MKKISYIFIISFIFGCSSLSLIEKKELKDPFDIDKGNYTIKINHIVYPDSFLKQEDFFFQLDVLFRKILLKKNKITIMFDEEFYNHMKKAEEFKLNQNEEIIDKTASSLTETEIKKIVSILNKEEKDKYTVQDILDLQIELLKKILKIDKNYQYNTELKKQELIDRLKEKKRAIIQLLEKTNIEVVINVNEPYKIDNEEIENYQYRFFKDIEIKKDSKLVSKFSKIKYPIYLKNLKIQDIKDIIDNKIIFNNKYVFIENSDFTGYKINRSKYLIFVGGSTKFYEYDDYKIEAEIVKADIEQLVNKNQDINLKELLK